MGKKEREKNGKTILAIRYFYFLVYKLYRKPHIKSLIEEEEEDNGIIKFLSFKKPTLTTRKKHRKLNEN